jgi:hypothetical protein
MTRYGFADVLRQHVHTASQTWPSLRRKQVSPQV